MIDNGDMVEWHPTVRVLDDGHPALLFYTTAPIMPETNYAVELVGEGYPTVTAGVHSPKRVEHMVVETSNPIIRPFRQTFFIPDLDDFFRIHLTMRIRRVGQDPDQAVLYPVAFADPEDIVWDEKGISVLANHEESILQLFNLGTIAIRDEPEGGGTDRLPARRNHPECDAHP